MILESISPMVHLKGSLNFYWWFGNGLGHLFLNSIRILIFSKSDFKKLGGQSTTIKLSEE